MPPPPTNLYSFTLHALLFITASVTAGVCLIGIWAGTSRRHWFLRAAFVLAVPLLCLPIRAYGPAIYYFLLTVLLAASARFLRPYGWFAVPDDLAANTRQKQSRRLRFTLVDLFLATTLVGLATMAILPIVRSRINLDLAFILGTLPPIACSAIAGAMLLEARTQSVRAMLVVVLSAACAAHVVLHYGRFGYWIFEFVEGGGEYWELVAAHVLLALEFLTIVIVGRLLTLRLERADSGRSPGTRRPASIALWGLFMMALAFPVGFAYVQMLRRTPMPESRWPAENGYSEILALVHRSRALNPTEQALAALRPTQPRVAQELDSIYGELLAALDQPAYTPTSIEFDISHIRSLARVWIKEAENAAKAERYDEMFTFSLGVVKWGGIHRRGGTWVEDQIGDIVARIGFGPLATQRRNLSRDQVALAIRVLNELKQNADPSDVIRARSNYFDEELFGWRATLARALNSGRVGEGKIDLNQRVGWALHRLMETELQIELFKRDHDRVPATLDELVPEYTSAVPLDPLSGQPFLYRVEHGKHVLYSVGSDRQDDGGRFGGWSALQTDGFDVDIETVVRKQ